MSDLEPVIGAVFLHNPGCNDPDEICAPHPSSIADTVKAMINNPEIILVPLALIAVAAIVGLARRKYDA